MIGQFTRELLWLAMRPATAISSLTASIRYRRAKSLRLHLGCGRHRLPGFVNIDINPRNHPDLWLDIRSGLPFPPASVAFIYTSHTLEHLPLAHVTGVLRECRRVLEPGGWLRIVVPDLLKAIKAYVEHNEEWFLDWPHSFRSVGGRFTNYLFCDSQHKCAFDLDLMSELLSGAGFATIVSACGGQSRVGQQYPCELARIEEEDERSLFLEARKP